MTKLPFSKKGERTSDLLALIHTDVCGPMSTCTRNGDRYFITFIDDYSRYGYVYLMRHKSESFKKFKEFKTEVENQLNKSIKALRSDRRGGYLSYEFIMYLKECGCLPLENLKDKQLKMNIKLLIIKHKKGKEKGQEKGPTDQKMSLMDSGATLFVPQGNPKCEARV
jgi:hypothetical protein